MLTVCLNPCNKAAVISHRLYHNGLMALLCCTHHYACQSVVERQSLSAVVDCIRCTAAVNPFNPHSDSSAPSTLAHCSLFAMPQYASFNDSRCNPTFPLIRPISTSPISIGCYALHPIQYQYRWTTSKVPRPDHGEPWGYV